MSTRIAGRAIGALTIALAAAGIATSPAIAVAVPAPLPEANVKVGNPAIEKKLGELKLQGASDKDIKKKLGLILVSAPLSGQVSAMSSNSAVSLATPYVYFDTQARTYYAVASWNFGTYPDYAQSRGDQAIGGLDGFGIRFSRQVQSAGGTLIVCPKSKGGPAKYSCFYPTSYWSNDALGTTWKFQDRVYSDPVTDQMNMGTGTVSKAFKPIGTGCTQIGSSYAHSWGGSSVNGFGIYTNGFSISWSDASKGWQRASNLGAFSC